MFDDIYIIGFNDASKNGRTRHIFKAYDSRHDNEVLAEQMYRFNSAKITANQEIFIHCQHWDDTVLFDNSNAIYSEVCKTNNNYIQGYKSIDRWSHGFFATPRGLLETIFIYPFYPTGNYS